VVKSVLPLKIVIPLVLGILVSLAIAVYAELGFRRLEVANRQMAVALEMQANLLETMALVVDAETGERGYLLTGKEEYLEPYNAALPKIDHSFHRLREMLVENGTVAERDHLGTINALVGRKLSELEAAIALYKKDGPAVAQALMDTGIGKRAMDEIRSSIDNMTAAHRRELDEATRRWAADIAFARVGMQVMTAFTVVLLLIVWLLANRDTRQREQRRRSAQDDKQRLEAIIEERTAALS
jgi:CHASE3 domain sensor protein